MAEKLRGTKVWVSTPGRGLGVSAGGGRPFRCGGPGVWYYPRKIFENSDAKSCILVASALISGLPRTCTSEQTTSMSRVKSVIDVEWLSLSLRSNNTCCEISCFLKTTAKKLGDQYIVGLPNLKVGGPVSPGPHGCCAYDDSCNAFSGSNRRFTGVEIVRVWITVV